VALHLLTPRSLVVWLFRTYWRRKRELPVLLARPGYRHLTVVRLRSEREVAAWLEMKIAHNS